jgi:hypothetical protein
VEGSRSAGIVDGENEQDASVLTLVVCIMILFRQVDGTDSSATRARQTGDGLTGSKATHDRGRSIAMFVPKPLWHFSRCFQTFQTVGFPLICNPAYYTCVPLRI